MTDDNPNPSRNDDTIAAAIAYHREWLERLGATRHHEALATLEKARSLASIFAAAATRFVYGTTEDLERAVTEAAEQHREDVLFEQHASALRRAIGPALRHAETYGTGWIRIDARCAPGHPVDEVFDWTISSPNPRSIAVHDETTTEEGRS